MNTYTPNPIDVSDVTLPEELEKLANLLAKNVHDVWSEADCSRAGATAPSGMMRKSRIHAWCLTRTCQTERRATT